MDKYMLLALATLLPALSAVLCYVVRNSVVRKVIVFLTTVAMFAVAGSFFHLVVQSGGKVAINLEELHLPVNLGMIIKIADFALLGYIAYLGCKLKKPLIVVLAVLQAIPLLVFEFTGNVKEPHVSFLIDYLSLIMILLVSIIGPVITVFALGYMQEHEHHLHLPKSRQPRFFAILFIFLSAMNALVMTNDLSWMLLFWEVTTLCSFLLISHDGNEQAINNALRALWINMLGGIAFVLAIIFIYRSLGTLAIDEIAAFKPGAAFTGMLPIGLGLLCFAGFTKSAQFPFQSWLLGAMVAPTPVSALLHSSTMVKAGVYLVVRMAPAFGGTTLGTLVAVVGGFTFVAASAIAISQRNGKRVLAYSTIANLGLIICCAGIGSYVAMGAAILLMVFHAVSKGLLFLCVGTIENGIGSRDIEDMQGLFKRMPFTTIIAVIGMMSMLLPPFGVLLTKWLAIEAAVELPVVLIMIVLGSAFTVVFWAKWIGIILTASYHAEYKVEKMPRTMAISLVLLVFMVIITGIDISLLFKMDVVPFLSEAVNVPNGIQLFGNNGLWLAGSSGNLVGGFSPLYFFMILLLIVLMIPYLFNKNRPVRVRPPYLCGANTDDLKGLMFNGPADTVDSVVVHNYYFAGVFGEASLTPWTNLVAGAIILIMFGVVL
ncbi:MAG TPA: NADH-quinone oxidoreductase subunit L [Bacillota bacterium]|nr:NADH-quinone oxidoreductase subunit L [Bacillota bacterium]